MNNKMILLAAAAVVASVGMYKFCKIDWTCKKDKKEKTNGNIGK